MGAILKRGTHREAKLAEIAQQYLKKGMLVYIEGRIQTREWASGEPNREIKRREARKSS